MELGEKEIKPLLEKSIENGIDTENRIEKFKKLYNSVKVKYSTKQIILISQVQITHLYLTNFFLFAII